MIRLDYEGQLIPMTPMDRTPFLTYQNLDLEQYDAQRHLLQADFGYAITVHKSQGSEWGDVILRDDGFGSWEKDLRRQWLYTAITRASERFWWIR
jgi:exodeoxyribonuclease-5